MIKKILCFLALSTVIALALVSCSNNTESNESSKSENSALSSLGASDTPSSPDTSDTPDIPSYTEVTLDEWNKALGFDSVYSVTVNLSEKETDGNGVESTLEGYSKFVKGSFIECAMFPSNGYNCCTYTLTKSNVNAFNVIINESIYEDGLTGFDKLPNYGYEFFTYNTTEFCYEWISDNSPKASGAIKIYFGADKRLSEISLSTNFNNGKSHVTTATFTKYDETEINLPHSEISKLCLDALPSLESEHWSQYYITPSAISSEIYTTMSPEIIDLLENLDFSLTTVYDKRVINDACEYYICISLGQERQLDIFDNTVLFDEIRISVKDSVITYISLYTERKGAVSILPFESNS